MRTRFDLVRSLVSTVRVVSHGAGPGSPSWYQAPHRSPPFQVSPQRPVLPPREPTVRQSSRRRDIQEHPCPSSRFRSWFPRLPTSPPQHPSPCNCPHSQFRAIHPTPPGQPSKPGARKVSASHPPTASNPGWEGNHSACHPWHPGFFKVPEMNPLRGAERPVSIPERMAGASIPSLARRSRGMPSHTSRRVASGPRVQPWPVSALGPNLFTALIGQKANATCAISN